MHYLCIKHGIYTGLCSVIDAFFMILGLFVLFVVAV
jgi:hypothetical protein